MSVTKTCKSCGGPSRDPVTGKQGHEFRRVAGMYATILEEMKQLWFCVDCRSVVFQPEWKDDEV